MSLVDQAAREQALDPGQSFIVQAPAGSGKTGLLVRRLLALLCIVEKPEEILAITFTRKATAEMRTRVIEVLSKADKDEVFAQHEEDMAPLIERVLQRDQARNWQLIKQPQRLRIQTIDSLCAELVRKMPWSARFGNVPQIEAEPDKLYQQAAQNLLEKIDSEAYQEALSVLLLHANGDIQALKHQLANMLNQREEWLRLIFDQQIMASRSRLSKQWQNVYQAIISDLEHTFGEHLSRELMALAAYAQQHMPENNAQNSTDILSALLDPPRNPDWRTQSIQWRAISEMICTTGKFRAPSPQSISKKIGFPNRDRHKARLIQILSELKDDYKAYAAINQFQQFPEPTISDQEWQNLSALRTVLPALAQELYVLMNEQNCADYDELAQRAITALGTNDQPTDLALIQDYQLKHLLMDEFQDTSPTQLELLERLTAGWQIDDGRSLFFVGDPMQSIYAFRKADVRVFLRVRDQGINDIQPKSLTLGVNFRSSPNVINWVNQVMPSVFPEKDNPEIGKVKYSPAIAQQRFSGEVHMRLCVANDNYCEASEVLCLILTIYAEKPGAEIAVLARKRAPLALIAQGLREVELPFEAVELETLADQSIVQDLICLSGVFLQPMERLSWLSILRAPWCGACLKDLTVLCENGKSILESLDELKTIKGLSDAGQRNISRLAAAIAPLNFADAELPLSERVYRAWLRLRGPACYQNHDLVHAERFFALLETLETRPEALSRANIITACQQHKTSSATGNIKLMTFHKAKGLEFDQVILTGLASKSGGDNRYATLLYSTQINDNLIVSPSAQAGAIPPTKAGFIKQHQQSVEDEEAARLLYVAVTRAKKQLYLFGTLKRSSKGELNPQHGSLLHLLWPACKADFENSEHLVEYVQQDAKETEDNNERPSIPLLSLPTNLPGLALPPPVQFTPEPITQQQEQPEFSWAQEDTRIIGLAVHQLLQYADIDQLKSWQQSVDPDIIQASLQKAGLIAARMVDATKHVANMLQLLAQDDRAHWIFSPQHSQISSEWSLSCQQNGKVNTYIIDRSFVDENGTRWIIDFKTGSHEGGDIEHFLDEEESRYAPQLEQYTALLRALEPKREIRMGLYFPALGKWRERQYG